MFVVMTHPALILMDFQRDVVARLGRPEVVDAAARALRAARDAGIPVVFVRVAFRPGYPEVHPGGGFGAARELGPSMTEEAPGTRVIDELAPVGDEPVVVKRRVSAFSGSDLGMLLRAAGADELVLAGIATSGVVLSTVREAADLDYRLTVLEDACADADEEVHRVLTAKVLPRQAAVTTVDAWIDALPHRDRGAPPLS